MYMFLNKEELVALTGRKIKSLQIEQLRKIDVPFFINATGHPVVARAAIEGQRKLSRRKRSGSRTPARL